MSVDVILEGIWEDFKSARENADQKRMEICLRGFKSEYDPTKLGNHLIQKHASRIRVMESSIERAKRKAFYDNSEVAGSW